MPKKQTIYSRKTGEGVEMYSVAAGEALREHADEWSSTPVENPTEPVRRATPGTPAAMQGQSAAPEPGFGRDAAADTKRVQDEQRAASEQAAAQASAQPPLAQAPISQPATASSAPAVPPNTPAPAAPATVEPDRPDDLSKIKGIKGATERGLNDMGIKTYRQLAELTPEKAADIDRQLHLHGRLRRDDWVNQAKVLLETDTALRPDAPTSPPGPQTSAEQRAANAADPGETDLR